MEIESFWQGYDTRLAKSCIFIVIPLAEQAPKEKKSKEMLLEPSFVIGEDSNDNNNNNNNNNNNDNVNNNNSSNNNNNIDNDKKSKKPVMILT